MVERPQSSQRRPLYRLLSLFVSVTLIVAGVAVLYHNIHWPEVARVWTNLDPQLVGIAAILYWLQYPMNSCRLHQVIRWTTGRTSPEAPSLALVLKLTCSSAFIAAAAPIGLAGDAAKIAALRLFSILSITESARAVLFDRVIGVLWFSIIGLATIPLQAAEGVERGILLSQIVLFGILIASVGLLLVFPNILALFRYRLVDRIAQVFAGFGAILYPRRLAFQSAVALINFALAWGTLYLLLRAGGLNSNIWIVGGFIPLLQLVNGLPFLYLGWGGRELVMVATLGVAGNLTVNETLAISFVWGAIIVATGAVNCMFLLGTWRVANRVARNNCPPASTPQS